jgi:hypothetical protein
MVIDLLPVICVNWKGGRTKLHPPFTNAGIAAPQRHVRLFYLALDPQPSPHFSVNEINALPLHGHQAVTAITALWL